MTTPKPVLTSPALRVLAGYLAFATILGVWSGVRGDGGLAAIVAYMVLLATVVISERFNARPAKVLRDWLPLLALPVLYAAIPRTAIDVGPFDRMVQGWDRFLFGTDAAKTLAGALPWRPLSEVLHAAYLSYYGIIYLPPLLMYLRGDREAFAQTVLAFTMAMVVCFAVFCVLPVEGPRYNWPAPAGVPEGFFRRVVNAILEQGSSRGTAFPSSHQAIALTMGLSSMRWDRRLGVPLVALSILLGVGAVYGGFHYGVDMLAGAAVAFVASVWITKRSKAAPA